MTLAHPTTEILADYASGAASEGVALMVAGHACLCAVCRERIEALEAVGAAFLAAAEPAPPPSLEALLARLDEEEEARPAARAGAPRPVVLPDCVAEAAGGDLAELDWLLLRPGVFIAPIEVGAPDETLALYRLKPGKAAPSHRHGGEEMMLILHGSLIDEGRVFRRGDLATAGVGGDHKPRAGFGEDCVCLSLHRGAIRLVGRGDDSFDLAVD